MQNYICGIDEAGRGSAVGSMFITGVCVKTATKFSNEIKDSKQIIESKRNILYSKLLDFIQQEEGAFEIIKCDNEMIDSYGLSYCIKFACEKIMNNIYEKISMIDVNVTKDQIDFIIDGNTSYKIAHLRSIIKGDTLVKAISAASIISKYNKDKECKELHLEYPQYDFKNNKGYLSAFHIQAINKYGLCKYHRKSFKLKSQDSLF